MRFAQHPHPVESRLDCPRGIDEPDIRQSVRLRVGQVVPDDGRDIRLTDRQAGERGGPVGLGRRRMVSPPSRTFDFFFAGCLRVGRSRRTDMPATPAPARRAGRTGRGDGTSPASRGSSDPRELVPKKHSSLDAGKRESSAAAACQRTRTASIRIPARRGSPPTAATPRTSVASSGRSAKRHPRPWPSGGSGPLRTSPGSIEPFAPDVMSHRDDLAPVPRDHGLHVVAHQALERDRVRSELAHVFRQAGFAEVDERPSEQA